MKDRRDPRRGRSNPHDGRSRGGLSRVETLAGRIADIDASRWTCTVVTEVHERLLYDVEIPPAGYLHPTGEGQHAMPDVGAAVWVTFSSEGDVPAYISEYRAMPKADAETASNVEAPDMSSNRPRMAPGDMGITGRDGNGVWVRRGKLTEIIGGALTRTLYIGREGVIRHIAKGMVSSLMGGEVAWTVAPKEKHPRGKRWTSFAALVKELASDKGSAVEVEAGGGLSSASEGDTDGAMGTVGAPPQSGATVTSPVLRVKVKVDGTAEAQNALLLLADRAGQLELSSKGKVHVTPGDVVQVGTTSEFVLVDAGFSAALKSALDEISATVTGLGGPVMPSVVALSAQLEAGAFTASKLKTE